MDITSLQINNEYKFSKAHTVETVKDNLIQSNMQVHVDAYSALLLDYYTQKTDFTYEVKGGEKKEWTTKKERFEDILEWTLAQFDEIAWDIVVWCTIKPIQPITEAVGKIFRKFGHATERQCLESAAEFIDMLGQTPFVEFIKPRYNPDGVIMIKSCMSYDDHIYAYLKEQRHVLPSLVRPTVVESNMDSGYQTIKSSLIMGGKYHNYNICLDNLNRQNSVAFRLNTDVIMNVDDVFQEKDDEPADKRDKRYRNWSQLKLECAGVWATLVKQGNHFYLTHRTDERGRTSPKGFHCNTQGDDYRKAVIELANPMIVEVD